MVEPRRAPLPVRAVSFAWVRALKTVRHVYQRVRTKRRSVWYRLRETATGNALWKAAEIGGAPLDRRRRSRLAVQHTRRVAFPALDRSAGYRLLGAGELAGVDEVVAVCRRVFEAKIPADARAVAAGPASGTGVLAEKRKFLQNLLTDHDLREHPSLVDFALSDALLGTAADYLRAVPRLTRVDLLYSVPRAGDDRIASQLFHLDPEGVTQAKLFLNVFDTGEAEGPFTFIPAVESARIVREVRRWRQRHGRPHSGRYTDEEIAAVGGADAVVTVNGPAGSGVVVDTTRCLHLGSRVRPGAFRLCLYIQYCTSRERGNVFDADRYRDDPVRYLAVAHSAGAAASDLTAPDQAAG